MTQLVARGEPFARCKASKGSMTLQTGTPDLAQLKAGMKAAWMAGDFGQIASFIAPEGEQFISRLNLKPGVTVLDIACGTGNTAIPAARAGAKVIGVDIATNLLEQARTRAAAAQLDIEFKEGDAEELPNPDRSFDVVVTMSGATSARRAARVAAALVRVCNAAGVIAMANWSAQGFVSESFAVTVKMARPP